ncbi:sugar transferase [Pseudoclostridium thermosuccinogenes]|jgi:undecaprenyl phosphate N,N'-diacetylbacillosamine 1-phosphate transferase|uniref:sugar transferase n=1 Tax=Clostridium thermosuccinogenes TaxID=84032 RepID=UPI000CCC9C12|nr:sugar transferase [Pseudoclostridium thermosuccinogenes]
MLAKRFLDIALSLVAAILGMPLIIAITVLVLVKLGRPVLFTQERVGRKGRIFRIYKFRTMVDAKDSNGNPLPDAERLTGFGKWLRSTSLDELPELLNVIKGDMSLVGPRPLLVDYLPLYNERQMKRHDVLPGITGWAQVNGRNLISWEKKFELDLWYVDNWSLWLDIKIILMTVVRVLKREGINQSGMVTVERFNGYN